MKFAGETVGNRKDSVENNRFITKNKIITIIKRFIYILVYIIFMFWIPKMRYVIILHIDY